MMIILLTGLSGAGKSTLARSVALSLRNHKIPVEIIDGDEYRHSPICKDLGFSEEDRRKNLERLFFIGTVLMRHNIVVLLAAINPFEELRQHFSSQSLKVKTVWIRCDLDTLIKRDAKGFYRKALLPDGDPEKIYQFTGISSPYEEPVHPDLILDTAKLNEEEATLQLYNFICKELDAGNSGG